MNIKLSLAAGVQLQPSDQFNPLALVKDKRMFLHHEDCAGGMVSPTEESSGDFNETKTVTFICAICGGGVLTDRTPAIQAMRKALLLGTPQSFEGYSGRTVRFTL